MRYSTVMMDIYTALATANDDNMAPIFFIYFTTT